MLKSLNEVVERMKKAQKVLVMGHIKPDGDDISSVATLVLMLRKLGKEAQGCIADDIPWFYKEIPHVSLIKKVEDLRDYDYDTSITVDASEISRIGDSVELLKGKKPDITLDHHKTNVGFGEYDFYDPNYAATAVIVYEVGKMLGIEYDPELAEINLLGIATDTGFFRYSNTDQKVFKYAGELVEYGANIQHIASAVLEHKTLNEIKLQSEMIDTLKVEEKGKLAWAYISAEMFKRNKCTDEDAGGFVSEIRALYGVEVAILFIEWPENQVNISFRSKNYVDVSEIAMAFGGGGHARASGCSCKGVKLKDTIEKVVTKAKEVLAKYETESVK
jgi:phosphoesterase RecJ-like protein